MNFVILCLLVIALNLQIEWIELTEEQSNDDDDDDD